MPGNSKLIVAVLILGAGVSAALPFRRDPPSSTDEVGTAPEILKYRAVTKTRSAARPAARPAAPTGRMATGSQRRPWLDAATGGSWSARGLQPARRWARVPEMPPHYDDPPAPTTPAAQPVPPLCPGTRRRRPHRFSPPRPTRPGTRLYRSERTRSSMETPCPIWPSITLVARAAQ